MKEDLLKIIKHYGVNAQQRQFAEEVFELQEAITQHELKESVSYEIPLTELTDTREHIAEELEDEIWKNWKLTREEKKKILKQIRGDNIG